MFHDFWTRKILATGETADDYREVTEAEKQQLEAASETWVRPPQVFIDQWNEAAIARGDWGKKTICGRYNEETGYFELNGILDIAYEEAVLIFEAQSRNTFYNCRTNLPLYTNNASGVFTNCTHTRVLMGNPEGNSRPSLVTTQNCNFRSIAGFRITSFGGLVFAGWGNVEEIKWMTITAKGTMPLGSCSKLSAESIRNVINGTIVTGNILHVHADVMAKLTGDTTNAAAAALSETELAEWMALVPHAAEKNIVFIN